MFANAGSSGSSINSIQATKGFTSGDARVTVSPTIDMGTKDVNVDIGYDAGKTNVEVRICGMGRVRHGVDGEKKQD